MRDTLKQLMSNRPSRKFLLIGWDAADWRIIRPLMAKGWMPHLRKLVDEGASGDLTSVQPMLCPMLWTSIATGKRAYRHGVHGETEPKPGGEGTRPFASTSRSSKAIWNILSQNGIRTNCVNWQASHPAEPINGVCVSNRFAILPASPGHPWPRSTDVIHPPSLGETLERFRVRPEELDAPSLLPFIPRLSEIDQEKDKRVLACAMLLARASTLHAATTWIIEHGPAEFTAVLYDGIELFSERFMDYHALHRPDAPAADVENYQHVVTAAYAFHDMMLGRLLELAGADTTVMLVSDHGYQTGQHRASDAAMNPADPAVANRSQGIWVMHGPRVKRGAEIIGASALDVTPTILTHFDIPYGADMDGRPWVEVIDMGGVEIDRVLSWDKIAGNAGMPRVDPASNDTRGAESDATIAHLLELGYTEPPDEAARQAADRAREANRFNLARSLLEAGHEAAAIPILEPLVRAHGSDLRYAEALFHAYLAQRRYGDARLIAQLGAARGAPPAMVHLALAAVDLAERKPADAIAHLAQAESTQAATPNLYLLIGQAYRRLRRWDDARSAFERALQFDPDNESAWHGLATVALAEGQSELAAELALRAISLRGDYADAHYHLGVALAELGRPDEAAVALRRCLALRPDMLPPYRRLAELFCGPLNDPARASAYRRQADAIILQRRHARRSDLPGPPAARDPGPSAPKSR